MAITLTTPAVWSADPTTPGEIESALLQLMHENWSDGMLQAPARVLNFVVIVAAEGRDAVMGRLDRIAAGNPARTIVVAVEPDRTTLGARTSLIHGTPGALGGETVFRERIELACGEAALDHLATIVYPVLANDVGTVVWAPHGHEQGVDALLELADGVLLDSNERADWQEAIGRIHKLSTAAEVIDLAWLRSTPWRERVAAAFDPALWRGELEQISQVAVRMHPASTMSALLFVGWLASRLGWQPGQFDLAANDHKRGIAMAHHGSVELSIDNDESMPVPGLAGITITTRSGMQLALNRGAGGLRASRTLADGSTRGWTVIGASRGEDGILASGVAHAALPDELFRPALDRACIFGGVGC